MNTAWRRGWRRHIRTHFSSFCPPPDPPPSGAKVRVWGWDYRWSSRVRAFFEFVRVSQVIIIVVELVRNQKYSWPLFCPSHTLPLPLWCGCCDPCISGERATEMAKLEGCYPDSYQQKMLTHTLPPPSPFCSFIASHSQSQSTHLVGLQGAPVRHLQYNLHPLLYPNTPLFSCRLSSSSSSS